MTSHVNNVSTTCKELIHQSWKERFDDEFVTIDTGPDGDGYDTKPDEWKEYFKSCEDSNQIQWIKRFVIQELSTLLTQVEEIADHYEREHGRWQNNYSKGYCDFIDDLRTKLNALRKEI